MQFTSALLLAGATVASAAAVPRTATPQAAQEYNITRFSAAGTPHSVVAYYQLNATKNDGTSNMVQCTANTNTSPQIGPFGLTPCSDPAWSWSFTPTNTSQGSGYSLEVTRSPGVGMTNETGCIFIPSSDIEYVQDPEAPTGNTYRVNYGPDFAMTYSETDTCVYA